MGVAFVHVLIKLEPMLHLSNDNNNIIYYPNLLSTFNILLCKPDTIMCHNVMCIHTDITLHACLIN